MILRAAFQDMLGKNQIQKNIFRAIERVNEVLLDENILPVQNNIILFGKGALLDSMGFVNFVVALEEEFATSTGWNLNLMEEINSQGIFQTMTAGELVEFLFSLAQTKNFGGPQI